MSAGAITLNNSGVTGYAKAIVDGGQGNLFVDKSAGFTRCLVCVDAESTQGLIGISNAFVNTGGVAGGIGIIAPGLKLRNSDLSNNDTGVEITGTFADLGSLNDPGNNDLASCQTTCVLVPKNDTGTFVSAIGNTWNPLVQEADANGHYSGTAAFFGFQGPFFAGRNFTLKGDPSEEILTSSAFGEASVTPRTLHQKASHSARLKVSWTHPRSWRKLRSIQLRLYRGTRVVAQLTINPRHPHLTDTGTLRLLAVTHDRKTVTGTVTVRPGRALAGRMLRVAVQATDIHGQRQLEPDVGSIHVAA